MDYEVGDILISPSGFGHVMMIYKAGNTNPGARGAKVIHGQLSGNFHIEPVASVKGGHVIRIIGASTKIYRPPWENFKSEVIETAFKKKLVKIADAIARYATYGKYRAIRLYAGSSGFGSSAQKRLDKYKKRLVSGFSGGKFVTTITCAEAVMLCYQLAFPVGRTPFFIRLDAAHTMPKTLGSWLSKNWTTV